MGMVMRMTKRWKMFCLPEQSVDEEGKGRQVVDDKGADDNSSDDANISDETVGHLEEGDDELTVDTQGDR